MGPLDARAQKGPVASVVAAGYTPIGNALRTAASALPVEGPRPIVLVSDGEDTCAQPAPCDVAQELKLPGEPQQPLPHRPSRRAGELGTE